MTAISVDQFIRRRCQIAKFAPMVNGPPSAQSNQVAKSFVLALKDFNIQSLQALCSCLPYISARMRFLCYVDPEPMSDNWKQMLLIVPSEQFTGSQILEKLVELVPEITWDVDHCRLHAVFTDQDQRRILKDFSEPAPAMPKWMEPQSNGDAVMCHFMPFRLAIDLCRALLENEVKNKKRDYGTLAKLLMPLYREFADFVNPRRFFFYNAETRLWGIDDSMEPSVGFLIDLLRNFLEIPFVGIKEVATLMI